MQEAGDSHLRGNQRILQSGGFGTGGPVHGFMPYHTMGVEKAAKIGTDYSLDIPAADPSLVSQWRQRLETLGCGKLAS